MGLYYSTENTREFKEVEEQSLEVGIELAPAVEHLISSYPKWTKVEELPMEQLEERMKVVGDLWERGILMTSEQLSIVPSCTCTVHIQRYSSRLCFYKE